MLGLLITEGCIALSVLISLPILGRRDHCSPLSRRFWR